MKNTVLVIGSCIVVLLTSLWMLKMIEEPVPALAAAILTLIGTVFSNEGTNGATTRDDKKGTRAISQKHFGNGDIVSGDKIINNGSKT